MKPAMMRTRDSLIIAGGMVVAALIVSATLGGLNRYDTHWKGSTLVKIDRLTGEIETCNPTGGMLICLPAIGSQ